VRNTGQLFGSVRGLKGSAGKILGKGVVRVAVAEDILFRKFRLIPNFHDNTLFLYN